MAKGAAKEEALGGLHSLLARVYQRTLEKYLRELDALENFNQDDLTEDLIAAMAEIKEPNPAMLASLGKFLKDNEIGMDADQVEELNSTARRLEERKKARAKSGLNLSVVPHVEVG